MDTAQTTELNANETAELEAAIKQMLVEMERLNEHIEEEQNETDKLKIETRVMLAALKAI